MRENQLLQRVADLSGIPVEFVDKRCAPGMASIGGMPIHIKISRGKVTLVSVGVTSGGVKKMSVSPWRGKGAFRSLVPHIKQALTEANLPHELWLIPISPVWERNYDLEYVNGRWKILI